MSSLEEVFAPGGLLAAAIPGYRRRADQVEMAQAIGEAIESTGVLVAEAGTGTGKTFAYLVPALLAGGKVIVSTGTKTLQDQLFDRDLPAVRKALGSGASAALLKGRANYVCRYRLRRAAAEGVPSREEAGQIQRIERFAMASTTGDRADLARDARLELRAAGGASPELDRLAGALERAARELRLALGEPVARLSWTQAMRVADFPTAVERVHAALAELNAPLKEQAERSE